MKIHRNALDNRSSETIAIAEMVCTVITAWPDGRVSEAADHFHDIFTFTDHALGLEFTNKHDLTRYLQKAGDLFPNFAIEIETLFCSGENVLTEWTLMGMLTEPFLGGHLRTVPIYVEGASVVQVQTGRISRWSDYYDRITSRREALAAFFNED